MRNQPKYNFFKNTIYALNGLKDLVKTETSFRVELVFCIVLLPVIFLIEVNLTHKFFMFISLMGILIAETINSAIERTVDLVTLKYHTMAKRAKDAGSAIVFLSIVVFLVVWVIIIAQRFFQ
jgi:diacylglycerol kinase (ATP)